MVTLVSQRDLVYRHTAMGQRIRGILTSDTFPNPVRNPWAGVCYALAVPLVYFFGNDIYAAVGILIDKSTQLFGEGGIKVLLSVHDPWHPTGPYTFGTFLLMLFVGLPLGLIYLAVLVIVFVPLAIVSGIMRWLITSAGGDVHTIVKLSFSTSLVLLFGACLFLFVFPLLWVLVEPLIAHTFGEITYERIRSRIYGDQPRFRRPVSLLVASLSLGVGGLRLVVPVAEQGAEAWRAEVKQVYFPEWPKSFLVRRGATVVTGIHLNANDELAFQTSTSVATVQASVEPGGRHYDLPPGQTNPWGFDGRSGELYFWGGKQDTTVTVYGPPTNRGRNWWHGAMPTATPRHTKAAHGHQGKKRG